MVELFSFDDVGQAYDLALAEEGRINVTLGRHINDEVTSFYSNSPSGFMVEYGWGGRIIEPYGATTARGRRRKAAPKRASSALPPPQPGCAGR
jgi:hypothetical protein